MNGFTEINKLKDYGFFSSYDPQASGELIGWEDSFVCRLSCSVHNFNDFSGTTELVVIKFTCSLHGSG